MSKDEEIVQKIKNSQSFNNKLKQEIIWYFHLLNETQKNNLLQAIDIEWWIIKNFLSSLKDKEVLEFEEIKTNIEQLHKKDMYLKELKEKTQDEQDIDNLLNNLDSF